MQRHAVSCQDALGQCWTEMLEKEPTAGGVVKFHTAHKLTLMAHGHWNSTVAWHYQGWGGWWPRPAPWTGAS